MKRLIVVRVKAKKSNYMGNNRSVFNGNTKAQYAHVKSQGVTVAVKSNTVKSHLALRSSQELASARCSAYKFLIP